MASRASGRRDQAMSALFGHARGAFTGATQDRQGLLKRADGGVLFLDEIGDLGVDEQAMLLIALEERRFLPVGRDTQETSDFQLLAGTNRDLYRAVAEGRFRDDLLARIELWTFELPALVDRPEDIAPNLDFELARWTERTGDRVGFNREAREEFLSAACAPDALWSGNFRDFNAAVTRLATLARGAGSTFLSSVTNFAAFARAGSDRDVGERQEPQACRTPPCACPRRLATR